MARWLVLRFAAAVLAGFRCPGAARENAVDPSVGAPGAASMPRTVSCTTPAHRNPSVCFAINITGGGSCRNGPTIVNDGLAILQKDGSHPSGQGPENVQVYRLPDLAPVGAILQTHITTGGYDTPMAWQYVDGRLIIRGSNRIICYDLRQKN